MAQFDVYLNPGKQTRTTYPFILDIQNELIADIATRIVVPLGRVVEILNHRPRKCLNYRTAFEAFNSVTGGALGT